MLPLGLDPWYWPRVFGPRECRGNGVPRRRERSRREQDKSGTCFMGSAGPSPPSTPPIVARVYTRLVIKPTIALELRAHARIYAYTRINV